MSQDQYSPEPSSQATGDPYQLSADAIVEPPASFGQALRQIGPGLILTASIVGTGELIATTNLGARAGFTLLWLVMLSCFIKVFVQIELGRYAVSSGETTLASFQRVPHAGNFLAWLWFLMMVCTQFQVGAMIGGCSHCVHMAMPGVTAALSKMLEPMSSELASSLSENPEIFYAFIITPITIVLLVRGRYHVVEAVCTVLVVLFTLVTVLCVAFLPWVTIDVAQAEQAKMAAEAAAQAAGSSSQSSLWIAAFTMIGITGVGAVELIAYPYWCLEKRYARYIGPRDDSEGWVRRALGWLRVMHIDAWVSMVIYTLATLAFYALGAAVLYKTTGGAGLPGEVGAMLDSLADMYTPVLGTAGAEWFVAIGGFVVLYSTLFAATAGNSRVSTDFLRTQQLIPFTPPDYRVRWIRLTSAFFPLLGLLLYMFVQNPVQMVIIGGVAQAITLPLIAGVAIYLRQFHTDRRLIKMGIWDVCLWVSLMMFSVAAAYGLWDQLQRFL